MRRVLTTLPCALAAACIGLLALVPAASATLTAAPEPVFTRTANTNHVYFTANKPAAFAEYRACIWTVQLLPGGAEQIVEGAVGGPGVSGSICSGNLPAGSTPFNQYPFTPTTVLAEGSTYAVCMAAYHWAAVIWQTEPQANGQYVLCPTSTVDRTRPTIGVHLANDAPVVNTLSVPVRIDYQDSVSPPWQGPNGTASNWVCAASYPTQCSPNQVSSVCSVPSIPNDMGHYPANLGNSFSCTLNVAGEGRYVVCSISADSAVPDDPVNAWNGSANSTTANLSAPACDDVSVDTTGPAVQATADAVNVTTGQLVRFGASATDPAGTSGNYDWDFGDNTPHGSGAAPTHTYTQAGTYVARAATADGVGNGGSGTVTITVKAAAGGGGGAGGGTKGGAGGGSKAGGNDGGSPLPGTGPGTFTPPGSPALTTTQVKASGAVAAIAPLSASALGSANGGDTRAAALGKLKVTAPSSFATGRTRLKLTATFGRAGALEVALVKGKRSLARGKLAVTKPGTAGVALKVPARLAAGAYALALTYQPLGGKALSKQLPLTVTRAKARQRPASPGREGVPLRGK